MHAKHYFISESKLLLMLSQIGRSRSGFSLVEIMVGMVLTTVIVHGATAVTHSHYESSRHLKKKVEGDERSMNNKFFSRKFISLLDDSDISVRYFKLPIKLSNKSHHCGEAKSGGCFMSLNEKGEISSVYDGDSDSETFNPLKVEEVTGINFFNDESTPRDFRKLPVVGDIDKQVISFSPVKYNSKVRMSAKKKYYVGWKLGDDKKSPFTIMSRTKNKFFLSVPSSSIEAGHQSFDPTDHSKKFFAEVVNFGDDSNLSEEGGELEDYTNMFYLYYKSNDPGIWGVFFLDSIMKCKKEGDGNHATFEQDCKNHYESLGTTVNWNAACDHNENSSGDCSTRRDAELKLEDYHLVEISDPSEAIAEFLPKAGSDDGIVSEGELWLDQSSEDYPYFPYKTSSVVEDASASLKKKLKHLDAPTSPHALIYSFKEEDKDKDVRVILFPVVFHKFFLKNRGEHKDLMTISDVKKRGGKSPDVVVRSLLSEAKVIFARQLGTMRISSFIFDNKKEEENEEQEEDEEEQTSEEQENT